MTGPHVTVRCRRQVKCDVCPKPATVWVNGPALNPNIDPRRSANVSTPRCDDHKVIHYDLREVQPALQYTPQAPCGAEMHVRINLLRKQEIQLDGDIPPTCPAGHVLNNRERAMLWREAQAHLDTYLASDQVNTDLSERMCDVSG